MSAPIIGWHGVISANRSHLGFLECGIFWDLQSEVFIMNVVKFFLVAMMLVLAQGCVLTKVVTVPMRVGGAVVSIVPGVGNSAHDGIDSAAEAIDDIPI